MRKLCFVCLVIGSLLFSLTALPIKAGISDAPDPILNRVQINVLNPESVAYQGYVQIVVVLADGSMESSLTNTYLLDPDETVTVEAVFSQIVSSVVSTKVVDQPAS